MSNLIKRDLLLSFYSSANFFFTVSFFILILMLIPFAFGTQTEQLKVLFRGVVWIALALSIIITVDRIYNADYEDGNLDIIMQKNKTIEYLIISKYITHWFIYCLPLLVILPILSFLFYLDYSRDYANIYKLIHRLIWYGFHCKFRERTNAWCQKNNFFESNYNDTTICTFYYFWL